MFIFWGLDGNVSWLENALGQHDSYATMFDKNYQPMPYFYSICKAFLYDK
ncbi:MAG: endo-1,4-beta-xylanase [Candidatus Hadarchaeum sp.]